MRILLKYGLATQVKRLSEDLLELSRKTKRLDALLRDPGLCEVVVVTLAAAPVLAETERLLDRLEHMKVPVRHVVLNQASGSRPSVQRLRKHFPELRFLEVGRRPQPIQGIRALTELAA